MTPREQGREAYVAYRENLIHRRATQYPKNPHPFGSNDYDEWRTGYIIAFNFFNGGDEE
jgi:hypothetical protein